MAISPAAELRFLGYRRDEGGLYARAIRGEYGVPGLGVRQRDGRLRIAKRLPLVGALAGELQAFRVQLTAKGRDTGRQVPIAAVTAP